MLLKYIVMYLFNTGVSTFLTALELPEFRFERYDLPMAKPLQLHNLPVDCAKELFKPFKT